MDLRNLCLFLGCVMLTLVTPQTQAAENEPVTTDVPVLTPSVVRLGLEDADIDDENFELGLSAGFISIENFGTQPYYALRAAWHFTEDLFFEANYGFAEVEDTPAETISGLRLVTDDQREFEYYNLSVGFNILPGEVFLGPKRVYNNAFYLLVGAGNLEFLGDTEFAVNLGVGLRLIITDNFAAHFSFQDIITDKPIKLYPEDNDGSSHHMQYGLSLTYFF